MTIIQIVKKKTKQIQMLLPVQPQTNGAKKMLSDVKLQLTGFSTTTFY